MTKENKISIHSYNDKEYMDLLNIYNDEDIKDTFNGFRTDRLVASEYIFMIDLNKKNIGFILLVFENKNNLSIDMGILKEYRNKGYGKEAMKQLKDIINTSVDKNVYAEVKKDNINANKVITSGGFEFSNTKDNNTNIYKYVKKNRV